jgi:PST family polysaccharide transporter
LIAVASTTDIAALGVDSTSIPKSTFSVGTQAVRGAVWTILFSMLNKAVALGGQIALAWFLLPADLGLVGLALSITSIAAFVTGGNLKNLLVQRETVSKEDASDVFWLSLALNSTAGFLLAVVAPLAGHLFKQPRVVPIILILAATLPFMALPTLYAAHLYRDLRFRAVAQIQFGEGLIRNVGAGILAAFGFGAYALVLPQSVSAVFSAAGSRLSTGRISIGAPRPRRWPALLAPATWLMILALVTALQTNGAIFVIGLIHDSTVIGIYSWGFILSSQAIFLLGMNLQGVLFPALSKLGHDPARQNQAFQKALLMLTLAMAPVCALQIVLARPVIELFFHARWLPAVPVVQWLSVGMITQPFSILGTSLLMARGQYRRLALLMAAATIITAAAALAGARFGREAEIARCTGITLFFTNLLPGWAAAREFKCSAGRFFRNSLPAALIALPLILVGALFARAFNRLPPVVEIAATTSLLLAGYTLGIRFLAPQLVRESLARFKFLRPSESLVECHATKS